MARQVHRLRPEWTMTVGVVLALALLGGLATAGEPAGLRADAAVTAPPARDPGVGPPRCPEVPEPGDAGVPCRPLRWGRYPLALVDGQLVNLTVHAIDRWVLGFDWAQVDAATVRANIANGWAWDPDQFDTNLISHPYHGGAVYAAARANGLTFLEAAPLVASASYVWEMAGETEAPSINDQLTTTFGGLFVGEVLWRMSGEVLDDAAVGGERVGREVVAGVMSPYRGIDRVVTGKAWRAGVTARRAALVQEVGVGAQLTGKANASLALRVHYLVRYGSPWADATLRRPFDAFALHVDGAFGFPPAQPDVFLTGSGALVGARVPLGDGGEGFLGMVEDFDYLHGPYYALGTTAFGPTWMSRHAAGPIEAELDAAVLGVVIGAVDSPHTLDHVGRDYLLGSGVSARLRATVRHARAGALSVERRSYRVWAAQEPLGRETLSVSRAALFASLVPGWGLGVDVVVFERAGLYADHEDRIEAFPVVQVHAMTTWPTPR